MKKRSNKIAVNEYLQAFYKKNHLRFAVGVILSIMSVPINLVFAWALGAVLNAVNEEDLIELNRLLLVGVVLVAINGIVGILQSHVKSGFIHKALWQYKSLAFSKLSQKSISAFVKENTSRYLSVLTNDVNTIEENYLNHFFDIVCLSIQFAATLFFMLWYSPMMTAATILLCLFPMFGVMFFSGEMSKREKAVSDGNEHFVAQLKDLLSGFSVLKSFNVEKEAGVLFNESNTKIETFKQRRRWWMGLMSSVNWGILGTIMQFGIFFIGAYLAITGSIAAGTVIVFVQVCNYLMQAVQSVPQNLAARKAAKGLIEKLSEITEENAAQGGETIKPILNDSITFKNVTFSYNDDAPVLKALNITLVAGKKYALVGASGSGKSTLMNLLMGAYNKYEGSIAIDGKELNTVSPDSLYNLISLIGQNLFLFDDTVRRNITMFKDFPTDRVQMAVERSGLTEFLEKRGESYRCGENGVGLSGGERQRISIARALLRDTPVLLLDEATAALDSQTAFSVTDSILHLDGLTRLVVTHRLEAALLEQYDEIFVLKNGTLWEQGGFEELMEKKGYFYSLYTVAQ